MNGLENQSHLLARAVAENSGEASLHVPRVRPFPSSASLSDAFYHDCDEITVPTSSVDDVAEELSLDDIDLAKIDVEGRTGDTLKGMTKNLARSKPRILCEVLSETEWDAVAETVSPLSYSILALCANGARPAASFHDLKDNQASNLLLLPADDPVQDRLARQ